MLVNLSFIDRSRYFSFESLLIYPHEAEWVPFQVTATQKIWQRRESNRGPLGLQPGPLTTRSQRRLYWSTQNNAKSKKVKSDAITVTGRGGP
jgi:hypothetical protein